MDRQRLQVPRGLKKVLLHSCCAPCSGEIIEAMLYSEVEVSILFYNPNVHPREEYEKRKGELICFADKLRVPFFDADYEKGRWFESVKGFEREQEGGRRCSICFDLRLQKAASYADRHGIQVFTTSLGISRWKNFEQVSESGFQAAKSYKDLIYWSYNWRKGNGSRRMYEIAKRENFYRQAYCGCVYSSGDFNFSTTV